ncbi:GrpB family protein [Halorussus caseinilyticus]|uniref:GrpB family protein n=1 Tax=Halorussus caseinilyticus TaxID=3034025 RepID=A0ABD5WQT0_9EURY|nr:GrpB family protein [Halorussus sp. DT72]
MVGLERGTVEIRSYRPEWGRHYEAEVERLQSVAGERLLDFEHIGSTAVEGLAAKPVIDLYREKLAFRDYLRDHPEVAAEYEELKRELADGHADDRDAYTAKKGEFVERVLADALDRE